MIIHSTRIVHDHREIAVMPGRIQSPAGQPTTIGQHMDDIIKRAAEAGHELGKIELLYDESEWRDIAKVYTTRPAHKAEPVATVKDHQYGQDGQ